MTERSDRATSAGPGNTEPTLTSILASYADAGFDADAFVVPEGRIQCGRCGSTVTAAQVDVHSIRRLEGQSDPADMSAVLALVCPVCRAQATVVVRFGPDADEDDTAVWALTRDRRDSDTLPPDAAPSEAG